MINQEIFNNTMTANQHNLGAVTKQKITFRPVQAVSTFEILPKPEVVYVNSTVGIVEQLAPELTQKANNSLAMPRQDRPSFFGGIQQHTQES